MFFYIPQSCEVGDIGKHFTADKADERVNNWLRALGTENYRSGIWIADALKVGW